MEKIGLVAGEAHFLAAVVEYQENDSFVVPLPLVDAKW